MIRSEAEKIAAAVNVYRPEWPVASLVTLLAEQRHRPARDVFVALAWVAADPDTLTPGRLAENGPWWKAASPALAIETPTPRPPRSDEACKVHAGGWRTRCAGCAADAKALKETDQ